MLGNIGGKYTAASNSSWNGGGSDYGTSSNSCHGGAGGGSTDIAICGTVGSTTWNDVNHFKSRIIVAGGRRWCWG